MFDYSFKVEFEKIVNLDNFFVYLQPSTADLSEGKGLQDVNKLCKVETTSIFNIYARMTKIQKFLLIVSILSLFVVLVAWTKKQVVDA